MGVVRNAGAAVLHLITLSIYSTLYAWGGHNLAQSDQISSTVGSTVLKLMLKFY